MQKKCLVIGGNGFIGKNLIADLKKYNYDVVVFDIDTNPMRMFLQNDKGIEYIAGDINNTQYLIDQIANVHFVVWLIHTTVPATSMYNLEFDLQSNILPLIRFVQQILEQKHIRRFVYLSSGGAIYGNPDITMPIDENYNRKKPISSYGLTKLVAENYLNFLFSENQNELVILRPSNVYGRYQNLKKPQGLIGHILKSIILHEPITIFGDGSIVRDYIHVSDLSNAIIKCFDVGSSEFEPLVLNIGSGLIESINDILEIVANVTKQELNIIRKPARNFDCQYNVLSIHKAQKILNWSPLIDLTEGITDVWNWIKNEYNE
jgi:UDP-glucose 4-epimerase